MAKKITHHGLLHDYTDFEALIEAQANTPTFLDGPKEYVPKIKKNYDDKHKKLILSYKKVDPKNKNNL